MTEPDVLEGLRSSLLHRLPALSMYFGMKPWDVERLTGSSRST